MMPHQHCNNIITVNIAEAWLQVATCHLCDDCENIYVADNFQAKEGGKLTDDLFMGKPLGVGLQVCPLTFA